METHDAAVKIALTHDFHMYVALIVASALAADCETLYGGRPSPASMSESW